MTELTRCWTWTVLLRAAAWTVSSKLEKRLVDHLLRSTQGSIGSKVQLEVSYSELNSTHGEIAMLAAAQRSWAQCLQLLCIAIFQKLRKYAVLQLKLHVTPQKQW